MDDLAQLLGEADMSAVLKDFGRRTRREDPVVHFYETFLKEYDPETREMRGVYYTPEPVVSYIVRSVDCLLQNRFGRRAVLSDTDTLILDPAAGTGTFVYTAIKLIRHCPFETRVRASRARIRIWIGRAARGIPHEHSRGGSTSERSTIRSVHFRRSECGGPNKIGRADHGGNGESALLRPLGQQRAVDR